MLHWKKISLVLCVVGFLKEIRPSEPFIYEFLLGPWRNLTSEMVLEKVYPVGTYSYLAQSFLILLITDLLKYKIIIVCLGLSGIIVWGMLLWTKSLLELQILEIFYGTFMASEVAYYAYIYMKVSSDHYQTVTAHTRAAILAGRALSGVLGQILISFELMDYRQLNYITFSAMIATVLWTLFLPTVSRTIYFHQRRNPDEISVEEEVQEKFTWSEALQLIRNHSMTFLTNSQALELSFWWSFSTCGYIQIQTYMQPLWHAISTHNPEVTLYNGTIESILTVLSFLATLSAGILKINWSKRTRTIEILTSFLCCTLLIIASQTQQILVCYLCYVFVGILYNFTITVVSFQIAKCVQSDSYGLVFGIVTFVALALQSLLTAIVVTDGVAVIGFALAPRDQYLVYGVYHFGIAMACFLITCTKRLMEKTQSDVPV